MESKKLSCGVLVISDKKVLIQHVTNQKHWDFPKGTQDSGESPRETAVRELHEETGIQINESELNEISWYEYNRFKDLYLFSVRIDDLDVSNLKCSSKFSDEYGNECDEADEYLLVEPHLLVDYMCFSMCRLLELELEEHIHKEIKKLYI